MSVFAIVFPLLFIASLGFFASRFKWFSREQVSGISQFAFFVSIPALLFNAMLKVSLAETLNPAIFVSFYGPVLLCFGLSLLLFRLLSRKPLADLALMGLGGSYSNTLLVGLPVVIAAFGPAQMKSVFLLIPFHSALLFGLTFLVAGKGQASNNGAGVLKTVLLNPVVLSISLGLLGNLGGLSLPAPMTGALEMLAKPAIACALFVLGANLNHYHIGEGWRQALLLSLLKLLLLPTLVWLLASLLGVTGVERAVAVLLAASPLGVNAYLIALQLKQDEDVIASAVVISSALSVVTVMFWLSVLT
ncbi:AEC family transporter [Shewanella sedimentimangrovi]|uniref:AEC family transporter n=1 Tax=Shewanella sedimentimangrovi TaxID=2814293 RepID=A0ABX7R425_9GAMM|nr:AEC family transporter [Shewanella sedimentimangrovi]QSX38594.1 AEC family transporter [Shewanella sedimentimangrovi]